MQVNVVPKTILPPSKPFSFITRIRFNKRPVVLSGTHGGLGRNYKSGKEVTEAAKVKGFESPVLATNSIINKNSRCNGPGAMLKTKKFYMCKISFSHSITEKRNFGAETVNQEMVITINYDPKEDHIQDVHAVDIYQDGVKVAEISKLLDKAEGQPLLAMIEGIKWRELYYDQRAEEPPLEEKYDYEPDSIMGQMADLKSLTDSLISSLKTFRP